MIDQETRTGLLKQQQKSTQDLAVPKGSQAMKTASLSPASPVTSQAPSGPVTEYSLKGTRSDTPLSPPLQDIIWKDALTGDYALWRMEGTAIKETLSLPIDPGPDFTMSVTGDFNGDGKTDILFTNTRTGEGLIWYMDAEK